MSQLFELFLSLLQRAWAFIQAKMNAAAREEGAVDRRLIARLIGRLRLAATSNRRVLTKDEDPVAMAKTIFKLRSKHGWRLQEFKLRKGETVNVKKWVEEIHRLDLRLALADHPVANDNDTATDALVGDDSSLSRREHNHARQVAANKYGRTG